MQLHPLANFFGQKLVKFGWIWAKLRRNLGKIRSRTAMINRFINLVSIAGNTYAMLNR